MKKFQSLSDFQALPENQMKKTVGGLDFSSSFQWALNVTGCGEEITNKVGLITWEFDYQVAATPTCSAFTRLF
jgi:hypothetical protein